MPTAAPADMAGEPAPGTCTLGPLVLRVSVPPGSVLAAAPEACVLADETREGVLLVLTAFGPGDARAEELRRAPDGVVANLGLLREPRRVAQAPVSLLGQRVQGTGWRADVPPYGRRDVMSVAATVLGAEGLFTVLALIMTPPGDMDARRTLLDLAAAIDAPAPP